MEQQETHDSVYNLIKDNEYLLKTLDEATQDLPNIANNETIRLKHIAAIVGFVHGIPAYKIYAILHMAICLIPFFLKRHRRISLLGLGSFKEDQFEMMPATQADIRATLNIQPKKKRSIRNPLLDNTL